MIRHKYLEKIGVKPVQQCFMSDNPTKQEKHRYKEYYKRYKKTGVFPSVTWSMDFSLLQWFYETTCEYLNLASEVVDLEYSKMTYNGQEYTQLDDTFPQSVSVGGRNGLLGRCCSGFSSEMPHE